MNMPNKSQTQLIAVGTVVAGLLLYVVGHAIFASIKEERARQAQIAAVKKAAEEAAIDRKARLILTNGLVKETLRVILQDKTLPDNEPVDAWGNPLRITVDGDIGNGKCVVTSSGPDQKFDTDDDIYDWRTTAMAVGKDIGKTTTNFGVGVLKGVVNSAKESVFGESK